jgi:acetylornithine/N-succinyldiaminopimelate aminotransferase
MLRRETPPMLDTSALMPIAPKPDVVMVRGDGSWLWDATGRRYLDFVQGWAVNALGHAPPEIAEVLCAQGRLLLTPSPAFHNAPAIELAARLRALSGLERTFFCNTGAEANEGAIKLVRKWARRHRPGAYEIVTTEGSFHGRTLATMAASGKPGFDAMFPPRIAGFVKVPFGDADAVQRAIGPKTAAVMVEPIQGEAGVIVPYAGYLRDLRALCDAHGILLVFDEVQTGLGRTGTLFCHQEEDARPDVMTLGKGLGGGVPIAALLAREAASCFEPGEQGGTFNGNPLMTSVGQAVLEVVARDAFLQRVREAGATLLGRLEKRLETHGGSVRGRGLLIALELPKPVAADVRDACFDAAFIVNAPRPGTLRLMPSLRVTDDEIDLALDTLDAALARVGL